MPKIDAEITAVAVDAMKNEIHRAIGTSIKGFYAQCGVTPCAIDVEMIPAERVFGPKGAYVVTDIKVRFDV